MGRLLCLMGLHSWQHLHRRLAWWYERWDVYKVTSQCRRCRKLDVRYDTDG